jgi:hypothetical protein
MRFSNGDEGQLVSEPILSVSLCFYAPYASWTRRTAATYDTSVPPYQEHLARSLMAVQAFPESAGNCKAGFA